MKKIKRFLALLLTIAMPFSLLTACSDEDETTEQEQKVIGTCAGYDVLYEELRYVTLSYKEKFEATYGTGLWSNPETAAQYRGKLEKTVWDIMRNNYAVLALCADYMDEDQMNSETIDEAVEEKVTEMIEAYGSREAFEAALTELNMTEHFIRFCFRVSVLENELYYILTRDLGLIQNDQNVFADWLEDGNAVYVQHIYVSNDQGEDVAANRAKAEEARRQLIEGEKTVEQLIASAMNEDMNNTAPYYIVRDVYTEVMETAAFSLENDGDVSEVVETPDGFYVLVRMPESEATFVSKIPSLLQSYQWAKLEAMVEEKKGTLAVELNDYGKTIDLVQMQ
ncbi:MAG: peptidylprolyl isomerase [Clostridia bacterium]|nr:peptidylprolyl isomerase [Clostridia bacterium]